MTTEFIDPEDEEDELPLPIRPESTPHHPQIPPSLLHEELSCEVVVRLHLPTFQICAETYLFWFFHCWQPLEGDKAPPCSGHQVFWLTAKERLVESADDASETLEQRFDQLDYCNDRHN